MAQLRKRSEDSKEKSETKKLKTCEESDDAKSITKPSWLSRYGAVCTR